uniref:ribosomal protein S10 n=1 Tax=Scytothamnus australis TaxID=66621 RepID=UPI002E75C69D|nr:ribosomal protein S10 [Scytothamnus australis]WBP70319.1 ribosomal protein S10 [Scytothamnus australis]
MSKKGLVRFKCEVWCVSTNLTDLKLWGSLILPPSFFTGLRTRKKRFTLLRSPLGNKTSKDQYERREYRRYLCLESRNISKILHFLDLLNRPNGVKYKVKLSSIAQAHT